MAARTMLPLHMLLLLCGSAVPTAHALVNTYPVKSINLATADGTDGSVAF